MNKRALSQILLLVALSVSSGCATAPEPPHNAVAWATPAPEAARLLVDGDQDGLSDDRESLLGTNPRLADTDADGLDDGFEMRHSEYGFDPTRPTMDSDGDGLPDSLERQLGRSPRNVDSDDDRYGDFDEYFNRLYGYDLNRSTSDGDFDGLPDDFESGLGSSPARVDSNGDGVTDFQAHNAGFSPGERIALGQGDLIGVTYSGEMADAIEERRAGGRSRLATIAAQLPYPDVTAEPVRSGAVDPSAALMQRALHNPTNSPAFYRPYSEIVADLFALAEHYDGSPGPDIVRLFVWLAPTLNCCGRVNRNLPGERIYLLKISDNPQANEDEPEVALLGMIHARELITVTITTNLATQLTSEYEAGDAEAREIVDNHEVWLLPVVNPNGYERARGAQADWRKNTRRVTSGQVSLGVDLERNYAAGHASLMTQAQRAALPFGTRNANGIASGGGFDENSSQYPHTAPFSEVETQAVRGLALSSFNTPLGREEIDGLGCSVSWHSFTGLVGHPMSYDPIPPDTDLSPSDRAAMGALTAAFAAAAGYADHTDTFKTTHYPVFGASDDWLYKDRGTMATFVEAYSIAEGRIGDSYYPPTAAEAGIVATNNYQGALALIRECRGSN
jgi:hypothetical protein